MLTTRTLGSQGLVVSALGLGCMGMSARAAGDGAGALRRGGAARRGGLALENREKAGATNVEFLKGHKEAIPLPSDAVDVIISNCVIHLSGDKRQLLRRALRVLTPAAASR